MAIRILPTSEVRDQMAAIIKEISSEGSSCFITQYGKAQAVMISVERFNELMSLVEDAIDEKDELLALRVEEAKKNFKKTGGIKFDL
jgi:PHD/YefM family antitoxin component YafN of YafNO toxin-antitoxin module